MITKSNFFRDECGYPAFEIEVYAFQVKDEWGFSYYYEDFDKALSELKTLETEIKAHGAIIAHKRYIRKTYGTMSLSYTKTVLCEC